MTDPNKNTLPSATPCEKKPVLSAETEEKKSTSASRECKSPVVEEQARLIKEPCPDQYTPAKCDKEISIPPNPRKKTKQNKSKTKEDDKETKEDVDPCENACFKTQDDKVTKQKPEDQNKPC